MKRKLLAMLLTASMIASMSMTVFAAGESGTTSTGGDVVTSTGGDGVTSTTTDSVTAEIAIDEVNFPDEVFRETVQAYDYDKNGKLSLEERNLVTSLYIPADYEQEKFCASIDGIQHFTELESFDVNGYKGSSINIDQNEKLKSVNIGTYSEGLTDFHLDNVPELTMLFLGDVTLKDIDFSKYPKLQNINVGSQDVKELEFTKNTELTSFGYSYTPALESVKFYDVNKITSLSLWGTSKIVDFNIPVYTNLENLTIEGDTLSKLDLSKSTRLKQLYIFDTGMKVIDISKCASLERCNINGGRITQLITGSSDKMINLNCNYNSVSNLVVSGYPNLEYLDCKMTKLSAIDLSKNTKLYDLNLVGCEIPVVDTSAIKDVRVSAASSSLQDVILNPDNEHIFKEGKLIVDDYAYYGVEEKNVLTSFYQKDEQVVFPTGVKYVATYAFVGKNTPNKIEIPEGVRTIDWSAFTQCSNLNTVVLPESLDQLGSYVFENCSGLINLYFRGDAPELTEEKQEKDYWITGSFDGLSVTAYYPEGNATWTDVITKNYGGNVTWKAWDDTSEVPDPVIGSVADSQVDAGAVVEDKKATVEIHEGYIWDALDKAVNEGAGIAVTVNIDTAGEEVDEVNAELSDSVIKMLLDNDAKALTLKSDMITLSLDAATLETIQDQVGNEKISVSIKKVETSTLSAEAQKVVGTRPVFDFKISTADGELVSDFGDGKVMISIPYTLQDGEKADGIVVYYIDEQGKLEKIEGGMYDAELKVVKFVTNHFSLYSIGYDGTISTVVPNASVVPNVSTGTSPETGDNTNALPYILMMMVVAVVGIVVFRRKAISK